MYNIYIYVDICISYYKVCEYMYVSMYVCTYVRMYVCMYVCMYVFMHAYSDPLYCKKVRQMKNKYTLL